MSKPVIVLIPGAWHTTESFLPLITQLSLSSYPTVAIAPPSTGAHPGHPSFDQDVAYIRSTLDTLLSADKDVVVVMHSGGSVIGSEALRDRSRKYRREKGLEGGVTRLVYISILLPKAGTSMAETFQKAVMAVDLDEGFVIDADQSFHVIAADGTSTILDGATRFYNDLPEKEADFWASRLTSCSLGPLMSTFTYEAWNDIPAAYILPLNDKTIPAKQARQSAERAGVKPLLEIEAGHNVYLSQPKVVADFIISAIDDVTL